MGYFSTVSSATNNDQTPSKRDLAQGIPTSSNLALAAAAGESVCRSHPPERLLTGVPGMPPLWTWLPLDTLEA